MDPQQEHEQAAAQQQHHYHVMEGHRHPHAPWNMVTNAVIQIVAKTPNNDRDVDDRSKTFTILDLASGSGEPALSIAKACWNVKVCSTDISPSCVATAAKAAQEAGLTNLSTLVVDMTDLLSHTPAESIDIVTCCSGLMFPQDKDKVLAEIYKVLKPNGTLIATTWDFVCGYALVMDIIQDIQQPSIQPILNPLALSEPGLIQRLLEQAGFSSTNLQATTSSYPINIGNNPDFQFKSVTMLIKDQLTEHNAWEAARVAFDRHIDKYATMDVHGNRIFSPNTFQMIIATKV